MQRRRLLSAMAALSFAPGISLAQEGKPLRLVVPFPPGGATDITARSLQESLARILKQPVVLDNRGGAGGSIGMAEVARAPADGLTIGVATLSTHGVNPAVYSKLPYHPTKDFVGVTEIVKAPGVIVVNPAVLPDTAVTMVDVPGEPVAPGWACWNRWWISFKAACIGRVCAIGGGRPSRPDRDGAMVIPRPPPRLWPRRPFNRAAPWRKPPRASSCRSRAQSAP